MPFFSNENRGATLPGNRRNILKRGNKVTKGRDLRPAQPEVRQRGGTSKERNKQQKRLQELEGEGGSTATEQHNKKNYRALSQFLIEG
jgi:hypothetical protein